MPRKKILPGEVTPDPSIESVVVEAEASPPAAPSKPRTTAPRQKAEAVVTKLPSRRTVKATAPVSEESAAEAPVTAAKPARRRTARVTESGVTEPPALEGLVPDGEHFTVTFRPRSETPPKALPRRERAKPERPIAKSPAPTNAKPRVETEPTTFEDSDLLISWRAKSTPPAQLDREDASPADEVSDEAPEPRRGRSRGRRGKPEAEMPAPGPEDPEPSAVPPVSRRVPAPPPPGRARIDIPVDAPQIVLRNGIPTLVRDHRVYPPFSFFGSPSDERRAATVLEELKMAADSGIHLHSFLLDFIIDEAEVAASVSLAAFMISQAVAVDPQAQVLLRLVFQAPRNWEERFPEARYLTADGTLAEPSVCDERFWTVAERCLEMFARQLRQLEQSSHILGVHLDRGEWFTADQVGYDTSLAARSKFRTWARTRYGDDVVTLRASWFDGSVRFEDLQIPPYEPHGSDGDRFIRSSRRQRRYVDYHLFLSDATVERIGDLAYAVKQASDGYFLVGVSYGYTFEWSHAGSGHLSLGKLLRTPEIDFIAGPPSYRSREPGGTAAFPSPVDSFALNSKLYISEEDYKTSLSQGHEPDDYNPALKTPQALDSVHWRGAGAALAHATGISWMDLWGNGWLKSASIWGRAERVLESMVTRLGAPLTDPEVAVFIDERSLAYLVDPAAFDLLVQNVRESVLRAGVSAAFYLLSDLQHREKFPDSKLYIFLNAWDVRPELRAAIKSRLQKDGKVLFWLYAAGLFDAGRDSLERAREVTGIALKPQPFHSRSGTTILNRRHPLAEAFPDRAIHSVAKLEPTYFAIPEDATVLGEYTQTGLPSFVVKEFRDGPPDTWWTSAFLGEPQVNPALIRALAELSGAHVWNFHGDVVHVRPPFLTIHCSGMGPRAITLPEKCSAFNLHTRQWAAVDSTNLRFHALDGSTQSFMVGSREELDQLLNLDPADLLRIDELPERETNVLGDVSNFDVPLMRLGEWIEEAASDEASDDWFLRAPKEIEEPESEAGDDDDRTGRRRRRRRGRGPRDRGDRVGSEEVVTARAEPSGSPQDFDEIGMNVVFRKRE